eukprot:3624887-Prymnesium_polylepis.2
MPPTAMSNRDAAPCISSAQLTCTISTLACGMAVGLAQQSSSPPDYCAPHRSAGSPCTKSNAGTSPSESWPASASRRRRCRSPARRCSASARMAHSRLGSPLSTCPKHVRVEGDVRVRAATTRTKLSNTTKRSDAGAGRRAARPIASKVDVARNSAMRAAPARVPPRAGSRVHTIKKAAWNKFYTSELPD